MVLTTKNLTKKYGSFTLNKINLELKEKMLFGCLGPNGAGKSTLVKLLTGQIIPTKGDINVLDVDVIKNPVLAKSKIGIIPEQESPPSFLTVKEYLEFICKVRKIKAPKKEISYWLKFFDFKKELNSLIKDLSRGTKQKVVATQAFIHQPKLVFIDEPLINLDPLIQKKFKEFLVSYVKKGNTVFLSTHVLSIADEICTDICILKNGEVILQESMVNVRKKKKKLENYFIGVVENEN
ncbi:ABC transporter ATP-binding protein [Candidatus Venteria ishoeyi]|uniref:Putative ABC transporter ATP-binding protein YbhF n=1 Tax=Candidatus Venteria ishoeyi TaxID=1899563 RepID=A0A1H6F872_9GAMM|nr:ABC transporter ATP-binding protein [Candidatus Venteria ishoeyi]SEH05165.1 putative ABC transporter ATP-binding protein YbhF [Candidatus Venteria ishoeyi]